MDYDKMTIKDLGIYFKDTGDDIYFTYLYNKIKPNLLNYIRKFVKDNDTAEFLFNEAMTKAYNKIHQYKKKYSISTWIYTIAYHLCLKQINAKNRTVMMGNFSAAENSNQEDDSMPVLGKMSDMDLVEQSMEDSIIEAETDEELQMKYNNIVGLIDETGEKYKDILKDNLINNLSYREIEEAYDVSKETVKCRIHRGKKMLKKMYNEQYEQKTTE